METSYLINQSYDFFYNINANTDQVQYVLYELLEEVIPKTPKRILFIAIIIGCLSKLYNKLYHCRHHTLFI